MATIIKDLPELVEHNIISPQTAADIEKYYATKAQPQNNSMLTIFGALGGILAGLGIILIFAHNWDAFSKTVKTGLAVLPLFMAQVLAGYSIFKNKSSVWKETSATLMFFAVGASISLVAQIYNISGDFPAFLMTWILLCLPLVYLLKSNAAAILLLVFSTWYSVAGGYFITDQPYMYLLFIAALLPFYSEHLKVNANSNMAFILNWLLPLSAIIALGAFINGNDSFMLAIYMAFFGLLYAIGAAPYFANLKRRTGYLALGESGIIIVLLIFSNRPMWTEVAGVAANTSYIVFWIALLLLTAVIMLRYKNATFNAGITAAIFCFPILYFIAKTSVPIATILTNLLVLAISVITIRNGIKRLNFRTLNFGLVVVAALTTFRFFDTNISFAIRGSLFLIVGIGFFVTNLIVVKRKKDTPNNFTHEN